MEWNSNGTERIGEHRVENHACVVDETWVNHTEVPLHFCILGINLAQVTGTDTKRVRPCVLPGMESQM